VTDEDRDRALKMRCDATPAIVCVNGTHPRGSDTPVSALCVDEGRGEHLPRRTRMTAALAQRSDLPSVKHLASRMRGPASAREPLAC
jgi:hypothetical protein